MTEINSYVDLKWLPVVEKFRHEAKINDDARDAGLNPYPENVDRFDNIRYGDHGDDNLLDLYRPHRYQGKLPVIVHVHGGGYVYGTKETYQFYGLAMARMGFAFINFNYRKAPEVEYPSELRETNQVFHWLVQHADKYDLDLNNVFIAGDSAGAQMAEQYLVMYTNPEYAQLLEMQMPDLKLKAGLLNCGCYFLERQLAQPSVLDAYFTGHARSLHPHDLKVEDYITKDFLPVFVMTANQDFLHDTAVRFDQYLLDRKIPHEFRSYGDSQHPRSHVFHVNQKDPEIAARCNADEIDFLRRFID